MIDTFSIPNMQATLAALQNVVTSGLQTEGKDENWDQRTHTYIWK